jgi:hypothetical protein
VPSTAVFLTRLATTTPLLIVEHVAQMHMSTRLPHSNTEYYRALCPMSQMGSLSSFQLMSALCPLLPQQQTWQQARKIDAEMRLASE